jgi:hypothetical protein
MFTAKLLHPIGNSLALDLTLDNFGLLVKEGSIIPTYAIK